MNTQSHAIINVALLSRKATPHLHRYALIGAALPDLPMFIFFAVEAFILKHPQRLIWSERYFLPGVAKPLRSLQLHPVCFSSFLGLVTGTNPTLSLSSP